MTGPGDSSPFAYYQSQTGTIAGSSTARGFDEGWAAPVAIFDAFRGFGEAAWVDSLPLTTLATRLQGSKVTWCCGRHAGRTSRAGSSVLQPKGSANHSRAEGAVRFSHIYLTDRLVDRVADSIRPGAQISGRLRDDLVFLPDRCLDALVGAQVTATVSGASALELEAAAILLVSHLLRSHHGFTAGQPARGGLAPWQLKRACEAMEAHLDGDIGLDMLAGVAGCSPTHFSRAFKRSTGQPPSAWLLHRRVERAKELLATPSALLSEVALAVGFSAQPQFTTAFKRVTGSTPGAWRREHSA